MRYTAEKICYCNILHSCPRTFSPCCSHLCSREFIHCPVDWHRWGGTGSSMNSEQRARFLGQIETGELVCMGRCQNLTSLSLSLSLNCRESRHFTLLGLTQINIGTVLPPTATHPHHPYQNPTSFSKRSKNKNWKEGLGKKWSGINWEGIIPGS